MSKKYTKEDIYEMFAEHFDGSDIVKVRPLGYNTIEDMKDVNPQKLHQDICGINKKYKLELTNPSVNDVEGWIEKIKN